MAWDDTHRRKRQFDFAGADQRGEFERDRDRILYSSAFRRLASVSQVVRISEAEFFHSRLAHSLKVAQIGRRLAQRRQHQQGRLCNDLGVDAEVVEAACLAHDLGHPPFGHPGEKVLNELVLRDDPDGFEGNAQSFRIVTKLAVRFPDFDGLDLTRATLAAVLKYPWTRDPEHADRSKKWGAYSTEIAAFEFARDGLPAGLKSAEAELMDWADDIAYSVHDLEDFHRCQLIPWHVLIEEEGREDLVNNAVAEWRSHPENARERLREALDALLVLFDELVPELIRRPYEATRDQRQQLRFITSKLIGRYIDAISLRDPDSSGREPCVDIVPKRNDEVRILKQITRDFVIRNTALAAQQRGQRRLIEELFQDLKEDVATGKPRFCPAKFRHLIDTEAPSTHARAVADCIASLTETEATALHARLRGYSSGSILDPIVR
jgi:dGTPase